MNRTMMITIGFAMVAFSAVAMAEKKPSVGAEYYGVGLCDKPEYKCMAVKGGQSWERLFPDAEQRDLVQRLNRTDTYLYSGRKLVVPKDFNKTTLEDITPFAPHMDTGDEKTILIDQERLAWAAYGEDGQLLKWGPVSSGRDYCRDVGRSCKTVTGTFYMFSKKDQRCRSSSFPVGRGGSHMPYCMFFYRGYAMHGSSHMVGHRDSHGCVRMFTRDAKWLNEEFVSVTDFHVTQKGTKVIVKDLIESKG